MIGSLSKFPEHRHADFELNFCIDGEFDIVMEKKTYHVEAGCTTFIPSMCSHAIPPQHCDRNVVTLIVGMSLLKKDFAELSRFFDKPKVYDLKTPENLKILELFSECVDSLCAEEPTDELLITGNIYKILSYMLKNFTSREKKDVSDGDFRKVENIEKALELIYYNYKEPITVEYAATLTGYSKSNFCKIFKKVVGESFHQALNRQRVNNAAGLLYVSNMPIAEISAEVGFGETKAFCRVFKSVYGVTPGEYRKRK